MSQGPGAGSWRADMEPVSLGVEKGQQDAVDRRAIAFFEEMIGELAHRRGGLARRRSRAGPR